MAKYDNEGSRSRIKIIVVGMIIIILACVMVAASITLAPIMRDMGAQSLADSVLARANQCYAIEGIYPSSLSYLEENYGLVVNRNDYVVVYESFADNVAPKVMVTPKG